VGEGRRIGKRERVTARSGSTLKEVTSYFSMPGYCGGANRPISNQPWKRMAATIARNAPLQKGYRQVIRLVVIAIGMGCAIKFGRVFG
jgi:hypothetical protein